MILAIYGAGAMGREAKRAADQMKEPYNIVFIDDNPELKELMGCPVSTMPVFLETYKNTDEVRFMIAIGEPILRKGAFERMKEKGYTGAVLIDPGALILDGAEIGEGTLINKGAFIDENVKIGRNCNVGYNAVIGHDTSMDDHSRLGPGVFVGGHVKIESNVFVGANAALRDRITIGSESVVSIASAVLNDMPPKSTAIGNPAKVIFNNEGSFLFAPSAAQAQLSAANNNDNESMNSSDIIIRYFDVFADTFRDIDFDPITFHIHDLGWDSLAQMTLIAKLEDSFNIVLDGEDPSKVDSYKNGLELIRKKLKEKKNR